MLFLGISEAISSFGIWIVSGIYKLAAFAFEIFLILSNAEVLGSDSYDFLINNCYVILGVVMLFIVAFSLLKAMINPDDQKQGASAIKKMIVNLITSLLILSVLPTIFGFIFDFQNSIFEYNTFGRFFGFGTSNTENIDNDEDFVKKGAYQIVNSVYTAFFAVNPEIACAMDGISNNENLNTCQNNIKSNDGKKNLAEVVNDVENSGNFGTYSSFSEAVVDDKISFDFLVSLIAGLVLLYVGVSYCFDMAVRLVKLIFYQMIAPIPVMLRIVPEGKLNGVFTQWLKITSSCYLEVFIRILVLYFCVYLCVEINGSPFLALDTWDYGFFAWLFTKAFLFMGIITFMKQAPKLIGEITGIDSGNMKLGIKDKLAAGGAFAAGALVSGGLTSGIRNATNAFQNNFERDANGKWKRKAGVTNGQIAKSVFTGAGSTIAGLVSGGVRSGKAGWSAKSFGDMKNASKSGAQASVDARVKRANYRAAHHQAGDGFWADMKNVALGHISDFGTSVESFSGIKNAEQMKRENYAMDLITSARDTFDNDVDGLIMKEIAKGSSNIVGIDITAIDAAKRNLENKKAQGTATAADEQAYNNALREARFKLQNHVLVSDINWGSYSDSDRAKLSSLRVDAVKYKGAIRNNSSLEALVSTGISGGDFADDKDFTLGAFDPSKGIWDDVNTIDAMNKAMKRQKGANNVSIAQKEQQKYDDKK